MNRLTQPIHAGETALEWQGLQPFQLVSLLDMLDKYAYGFYNTGKCLENIRELCSKYARRGEANFPSTAIREIKELLQTMKTWCHDLENTLKGIDRIIDLPDSEYYGSNIEQLLGEVTRRLDDEIESLQFIYVPKDKIVYYRAGDLFGIAEKFPLANDEARLAGNCFATGHHTACVFHLMRVVEIGAKAMVVALKVQKHLIVTSHLNGKKQVVKKPVELCDWNTLKIGLQKALTEMEQGGKTSVLKKEKLEFFSHAVSQFGLFKDAWRNKVAHSQKEYQPGETLDIMNNVRHFMQHLSERVAE